jgi:hypothetical protein
MGYYLSLNGTNNYVTIPSSPTLDLSNNFKITMTFTPANLTSTQIYLMSKNNFYAVIWEYVNDKVEFYSASGNFTGTAPRAGSSIILPDATKHTIVYEYDGITFKGSLDGVQIFSIAETFAIKTNTDPLFIGSASATTNFFAGFIHYASIYKSGVLVGEWLFNQSSGTTVTDTSGNGNHATLTGGTWVDDGTGGAGTTYTGSGTVQGTENLTSTEHMMLKALGTIQGNPLVSSLEKFILKAFGTVQGVSILTSGETLILQTGTTFSVSGTIQVQSVLTNNEHYWYKAVGTIQSVPVLTSIDREFYTASGIIQVSSVVTSRETVAIVQAIIGQIHLDGLRKLNVYVIGYRDLNLNLDATSVLHVNLNGEVSDDS